ncbi:MAG: hypothetical protein ACYC35_15225 [Pirellulales bacterium]
MVQGTGRPSLCRYVLSSVLLVVAGSAVFISCRPANKDETADPPRDEKAPDKADPTAMPHASVVSELISAGWEAKAAEAVVRTNTEWFDTVSRENPEEFAKQRKLLARLGAHKEVFDVVQKHPEAAGLLAEAHDPELIARTLLDDSRYNTITGLYMRYASADDAEAMARALLVRGDVLVELSRRGISGAEEMLIPAGSGDGDSEYEEWLSEVLRSYLAGPDDALISMLQFLLCQGQDIRRLLDDDSHFRREFRREIWPKLVRLVSRDKGRLESYAGDPGLWKVLALPEGETLVERCGLLPSVLFFGPDDWRLPEEIHPEAIQVLLQGDQSSLDAMMKFGKEPLFRRLLKRPGLSSGTRAKAVANIVAAGPNSAELLRLYDTLSNSALADEVGPPPNGPVTWIPLYYTVYEVPKKLLQGRTPGGLDVAMAVVDPVFLFMGPLGPDDALKVIGKEGLERVAPVATRATATTLKAGVRTLAEQSLKGAAKQLPETALTSWALTQTLSALQKGISAKLARLATVEITGPVRFFFKFARLNRETFKRMTNLEARLFMRGDARVFIRLDRIAGSHFAGRFLAETAESGLIGSAAESDAGGRAIGAAASVVIDAKNAVADRADSWRKNVSAWWLMNASGMAAELADSKSATSRRSK